jgi:hypothetical protein
MTLAGGMLSAAGCGGNGLPGVGASIPCGNANPDPCICNRPAASADAKAQCDAKKACERLGGTWISYSVTDNTGTHPPHCETDGGADGDASNAEVSHAD